MMEVVLEEEDEHIGNGGGAQANVFFPAFGQAATSESKSDFDPTNNPIVHEQAVRLFEHCDWDNKGFIVHADLERLEEVLPLGQLELFFNQQDRERVGIVNRDNFLEGIKPLLLLQSNGDNFKRKMALPEYATRIEDALTSRKMSAKKKSKTILDENVFANNGDNVGIERKDQFNSISLAETDEEENGSPHWGNFRTKKSIQSAENGAIPNSNNSKLRKLTISIGTDNNHRVGLAKFHSVDFDSEDSIFDSRYDSPIASPQFDSKFSLSASKKNSREEKSWAAKIAHRPPFSGFPPATTPIENSPKPTLSNVVSPEVLQNIAHSLPPPPPYRSISQPLGLTHQKLVDLSTEGVSTVSEHDSFYVNRQFSQPSQYRDEQRTQFFYDLDEQQESSDAAERRNHHQFAKVMERASISHTDLTQISPTRFGECAFRRTAIESSLADEMREVTRKYRGTTDLDLRTPDRIFKVVFVGDSAVGKTCFLHRFCHNRFKPLFNATIGVDFTVKTIKLQDRLVAVQLWDTAGQERFRSITKQYFRKADGVVLMYDVTSEQSYLNVRNWIESVRIGVDDGCVMCLVGNKVDLYSNEQCRTITYRHGKELAEEFDMIFFETSAYTGMGINECMKALAYRLQQREMEHLEEALKLEMLMNNSKTSWCCI